MPVGTIVRRFAVAASLAAHFLAPTGMTAQTGNTIDSARISIGVSAGVSACARTWHSSRGTGNIHHAGNRDQGLVPPSKAVLKGFPSILFGFDLIMKRDHGKRY